MTAYKWLAQYNDKTTLNQVNDDGTKNAYEVIDRSKLSAFMLFNESLPLEGSKPVLAVYFEEGDGERLVWTRRSFQTVGTPYPTVFNIVGKKTTPEKQGFIMALAPDGQVLVRDNFADDGLFDEVIQ